MTRNTTDRVWFVTGASSGLGLAFTRAALAAGDRVVATARRTALLDPTLAEHPGRLVVLPSTSPTAKPSRPPSTRPPPPSAASTSSSTTPAS